MTVLGIDPGIARCGWGVVKKIESGKLKVESYGCVETKAGLDEQKRLFQLYSELCTIIENHKPDIMAVEKIFFAKNTKTAISVSQARGAILVAVGASAIPVRSYTPLEIKMALTGYGQADKKQVEQMVMQELRLKEKPELDDTADALAVALTECFMKKFD